MASGKSSCLEHRHLLGTDTGGIAHSKRMISHPACHVAPTKLVADGKPSKLLCCWKALTTAHKHLFASVGQHSNVWCGIR